MAYERAAHTSERGSLREAVRDATLLQFTGQLMGGGRVMRAGNVVRVERLGTSVDWNSVAKTPDAGRAVIVQTGQGSYATDLRVLTQLPKGYADPRTQGGTGKVRAATFDSGKIGKLDRPVTVGQPWEIVRRLTGDADRSPVESITFPGAAAQLGGPSVPAQEFTGPSPIELASEYLVRKGEQLAALQQRAGETALNS